jgi:tetratricopeptide (TPR) repeat protein
MERRDARAATALMEKAWTTRRDAMMGPPKPDTQVRQIMVEVHRDLTEAVAICRERGAQRQLINALRKLGHVEQDLGRDDATNALYEEAVSVSRQLGDPLLLAHSVRHLGDWHRRAGHTDAAEMCYDEALMLYRDHEEPPTLDYANAVRSMAMLKEQHGRAGDAKALWQEARDLYARIGLHEGVDECSNHLAMLER